MRTLVDSGGALAAGLREIRAQFKLPERFPVEVDAEAERVARRPLGERVDRRSWDFRTLDPATSTDLDQAFHIERRGADIVLQYAIADVAAFVDEGGALNAEAWRRGATQYLPDGKVRLYPQVLSEGAASLLPGVDRPAVVFHVLIASDGIARLDGVERATIRSRSKLAYDTVTDADLPADFVELAERVTAAERVRGAARVDPAEQEVVAVDRGFALTFRPRRLSEDRNAAMSLATNLAVADTLYRAGTGLFRVMPGPDERAVNRLRHTAAAFGLGWPTSMSLVDFERTLRPDHPAQAAMMMAIRRTGGGASYAPFEAGVVPWHAAVAATYAHATAPLRRLADRYVIEAAMAVANGQPVPAAVTDAFSRLGPVMSDADALGNSIDRAVVDLAEAATLAERVGQTFEAVVTDVDRRGARVQLCEMPVITRVNAHRVTPGDRISVRLDAVDLTARSITLTRLRRPQG